LAAGNFNGPIFILPKGGTIMAVNLNVAESQNRENRLGSITGYCGSINDLHGQVVCGTLANRERCFNQASTCNAGCALGQLGEILDAAVINHAPSGCAITSVGLHVLRRQLADKFGLDTRHAAFVATDMNENDTVFGATGDIKTIALEIYSRYKPGAIFIGTSCVSGVIGEDIVPVVEELRQLLPIPVAPVFCEGFRSKIWASGFDASFHAILTSVVEPPRQKTNKVNFINFFGSAAVEIAQMFANFGVEPTFLLANSTIEQLKHLSEAAATVSICGTLGSYLGNGLEERYGVPYVRSLQPHGIKGFETWLRNLGEAIGKQKEVEAYIERERAYYLPKIEEVKKELSGLRAVLGMGPGYTFNTSRVLQERGVKIVWASAWHFDRQYDDGKIPEAFTDLVQYSPEDFGMSVSDQQNYEVMNILNRLKPDIYFSRHPGTTVWAIKQGTPSLCITDEYMIFGYKGILNTGYAILDTVKNRSFAKNLADRVKLPYTDWWLDQHHSVFLKEAEG
jgi:nitrogenase molybdenum-iron protein alpha chain